MQSHLRCLSSTDRCRVASSNTMDITLSEAPIYVVIQTCLTPAPYRAGVFLSIHKILRTVSRMILCIRDEKYVGPVSESATGHSGVTAGIVVLQRQHQAITTHGGGFFRLMQSVQRVSKPGVVIGIRALFESGTEGERGFLPFPMLH